jgi:hypothetical protein
VAEPARLVLGRDHALDERLTGALVGAVGRIGREGDVDLVRDLEAHHQRVRPEAAHHLPHVPCPGGDVALLRLAGLVAHLELDRVAVTRVVLRESQELLEPGLTVAPEESRQPERERRVRTAQLPQLRQMPGRIPGTAGAGVGPICPVTARALIPNRTSGPGCRGTSAASVSPTQPGGPDCAVPGGAANPTTTPARLNAPSTRPAAPEAASRILETYPELAQRQSADAHNDPCGPRRLAERQEVAQRSVVTAEAARHRIPRATSRRSAGPARRTRGRRASRSPSPGAPASAAHRAERRLARSRGPRGRV